MQPLKLRPATKAYVWGGTRLQKEFDIPMMKDRLAEAWVLSCHPDGENIIENGKYQGRTLSDLLENEGKTWRGTHALAFDFFPVLIKLIDASDNLSVQVHPSDAYALSHEGQLGKTEAWYILDCAEDAEIVYGFEKELSKEEFRKAIETNTLLEKVHRVKVKQGELYFIPSGTLHAICKGILLAEVQQNSNVTYRVYDYGRIVDGKPRELHVEKALDVTNLCPMENGGKPLGKPQQKDGYTETLLTTCDYFTAYSLDIEEKAVLDVDETSFVSLVALDGNAVLTHGDNVLTLYKGESIFLPAGLGKAEILGKAHVLLTKV
ncbi:MAG: class I mannose-6-phosphate isomerase [Clostridia bacterium]|nr:class I mannose-6-phosphate isomerase [Clostridia bacterium]